MSIRDASTHPRDDQKTFQFDQLIRTLSTNLNYQN